MAIVETDFYYFVYQLIAFFGLVFMLLGLMLLLLPGLTTRFFNLMNVWIDTRGWFSSWRQTHRIEPMFYRHHKLFGGLIFLASLWIFITFTFLYSTDDFQFSVLYGMSSAMQRWFIESITFILQVSSFIFIGLGLVVLIRPSAMKAIEDSMNKWVNTEPGEALDRQYQRPQIYSMQHPRLAGALIFCSGLYLFVSGAVLLLK